MKKFLALTLSVMMILAALPVSAVTAGATDLTQAENILGFSYKYASNTKTDNGSDFTEMPALVAYGDSTDANAVVKTGNKKYSKDVAEKTYALNDATDTLNEKLTDGFYFTLSEYSMAKKLGTNEAVGDNAAYTVDETKNIEPANNTAEMVSFTENTGIDFTWSTAQTVARLHLWVWPANLINEYEIYIKDAEGNWEETPIKTGSLKYFDNTTASETNSTFCAIVLNKVVSTTGLRFVVKDLVENTNEVYITEAVPRSTNEINLISIDPRVKEDYVAVKSLTYSQSMYVEKSLLGYHGSAFVDNSKTDYQNALYSNSDMETLGIATGPRAYYWKSKGVKTNIDDGAGGTKEAYDNKDLFYVADFGEAKHKINKLEMCSHSSNASITGLKLMCSNADSAYNSVLTAQENVDTDWILVGEWDGAIPTSITTYTVADAPEARYWKVVVEIADNTDSAVTRIQFYPGMYSVNEYEASNDVSTIPGGFVDGDSLRLNDDFRAVTPEQENAYENLDKFWKFTEANTGIEWNFDAAQDVKRLDLWVWPANAIENYAVQKYDANTSTWVNVQTGSLKAQNATIGAADATSTRAHWNSVVLNLPNNEVLNTDKLRFVITKLTDNTVGAYIAEATVGDNNAINLLARSAEHNDGLEYSIYVDHAKNTKGSQVRTTPADNLWRSVANNAYPEWSDVAGCLFYAVRLSGGEHAINRIGVNINVGTLNEFEVWCSNDSTAYAELSDSVLSDTWQKVMTVKGDYVSGTSFDIPNSTKAEYWMIKVTECSDNFQMRAPANFYELAENELSDSKFGGTFTAKKNIILSLDKHESLSNVTGATDIYFALYDNSGDLVSITPIEDVVLDSAQNMAIYKVPTGVAAGYNLRAFIWDGSGSLKPLAGDIWMNN